MHVQTRRISSSWSWVMSAYRRQCKLCFWISGTRSAVYSPNNDGLRNVPGGTQNEMWLSPVDNALPTSCHIQNWSRYVLHHWCCTTHANDAVICCSQPRQTPPTSPVRRVPPHHLDQALSECLRTLLPLRTPSSDICGALTEYWAAYHCAWDAPVVDAGSFAPTALRRLTSWRWDEVLNIGTVKIGFLKHRWHDVCSLEWHWHNSGTSGMDGIMGAKKQVTKVKTSDC